MTWEQLLENTPCLIAAEQYVYYSRGQINFWSHLGEERPKFLPKFQRNPCRGRIESIKSAGKKSPRVTLETYLRFHLEILISCRICIAKYAGKSMKDPSSFASFDLMCAFLTFVVRVYRRGCYRVWIKVLFICKGPEICLQNVLDEHFQALLLLLLPRY